MPQWTIKELQLFGNGVECPNFNGIIMRSYKFSWISVEKSNICTFLIMLITGRLKNLTFSFRHIPNYKL